MSKEYEKIKNVKQDSYQDKEISIRGWVYRVRKHGNNTFVILRDGSDKIQAVYEATPETNKLTTESSIGIKGVVKKDPRAPDGYEIHGKELEIYQIAEPFPIQKDFSEEYLGSVRHLWNRSSKLTTAMKIKAASLKYAREWFDKSEWFEVTPPIINRSACEGGATLFELKYFDEKAYLSQSAQLYLEGLIYSLENVWSLTPSFRAEKSKTSRHLAEYWHLEGEQAWATFDDILKVEEDLVSYMCQNIVEKNTKELEIMKRKPEDIAAVKAPFERLPYDKAIEILNESGRKIEWGEDLGRDDELLLTQDSEKPVFLYGAPMKIKPFYVKADPKRPEMALSSDLLAPRGFGELTTGGQREDNLEEIIGRIKKDGFNPDDYTWYTDLRRYGSVPHSGFGLGMERFVKWACNLEHVRDAIPFPRTMTRSYP